MHRVAGAGPSQAISSHAGPSSQEDRDDIINAIRSETKAAGLPDTPKNCWATFIGRVKTNLHVAFTASPVGEAFRVRSQRFLATINSTVIDWFQPWPEVSLLSVARKFLDDVELEGDAVRNTVVEFMPFSFAGVNMVRFHRGRLPAPRGGSIARGAGRLQRTKVARSRCRHGQTGHLRHAGEQGILRRGAPPQLHNAQDLLGAHQAVQKRAEEQAKATAGGY